MIPFPFTDAERDLIKRTVLHQHNLMAFQLMVWSGCSVLELQARISRWHGPLMALKEAYKMMGRWPKSTDGH